MTAPFVACWHNYDWDEVSNQFGVSNTEPSLTIQSQADDVDINVLMQRYGISGKFPENPRVPEYGDFTHISDFRSAIEAVQLAEQKFLEFPASTRAFFNNDPQLMLDFASNPANMEALRLNQVANGKQDSDRGFASSGGAQAAAAGGGAPERNAGARVSERPVESGKGQSGGAA